MTANEHTTPAVLRTQTPTYKSWAAMRRRCTDRNCAHFEIYGGRGIGLDPSWNSYERFYADMGERPKGTTLDRIDSNQGYCKSNCRWADNKTQARNKPSLRFLTIDGVTRCLTEWEEVRGLPHGILRQRIKLGWHGEILFAPKHTRRAASVSKTSSDVTSATVPDGLHQLMRAQIEREFELAHTTHIQKLEQRIALLRRTLQGMATNSTACKMCALHNEIYLDAIARDDGLR